MFLVTACGGSQPRPRRTELEPIGLFEVAERSCDIPLDPSNQCERIQYVELVKGTFAGVRPDQTAFVLWTADYPGSDDFTYGAIDVREAHRGQAEYVVREGALLREWLLLDGIEVREYRFERYGDNKEVLGSARLKLKRVERAPELAARLAYPED